MQDSKGNVIEETTMHKQQNIWENVYKTTSRYDTNGFKNYELEQAWDIGNAVWQNKLLDSLIFNPNGSIKEAFIWQWDEFTNLWQGLSRAIHTYNQADDIENSIYQDSKNGVWNVATFREDWTYDQNGNLILMQMKVRHPDSSTWINFQQDIYLNTTIGLLKEKTTQVWIDSTVRWVNSQRYIYTYGNTVGLDDQEALVFDFFPNPSDNFLNIKLENESKANVEISDMQGRAVQFLEISEGKGTLDINNLSPNTYLLKIIQEDKISVKRFIKL